MRRVLFSLGILASLFGGDGDVGAQSALPSLHHPAPNPDGSEIAFVSGGDIWVVPASGGTAHLLVSHEANESHPLYSPDGGRLAFVSNRAGDNDIYVLNIASGEVRRLTFGDGGEELDAWSPDGVWIYFADGSSDPGGQPDIWRIPSTGGTPMPLLADEYAPEFHAAIAPDGRSIAIAGKGRMAQGQWWRNGHSHIDESGIWIVTPGDPPSYRRLTEPGSKNVKPMWTPDGADVVYVSDRSGSENLWRQSADGGPARALTTFDDGRVLFPRSAADTDLIVFERDFGIWSMRLDGSPGPVAVELRGAPQRAMIEHVSISSGFGDLALSPDGKKVAFVARGEVFAAGIETAGQATRVTRTSAAESEITWAPDSRRIAYASLRDDRSGIYVFDFGSMSETQITNGEAHDVTPRFSPDGSRVAYARNGSEVRVHDLADGSDVLLARGQLWVHPFSPAEPLVWSPDGSWLSWLGTDERMFSNVWMAPAGGGEARAISGLANSFAGSIVWSPDGETLYFDTQHRTKTGQVAAIDLVPRTPLFQEDRFTRLFDEEEPTGSPSGAATGNDDADDSEPVPPDFDGIRRRLTLLPIGVDVGTIALSPDGKTLVFNAAAEGQQNLYAYSVDPEAEGPRVTRQLTSTAGFKSRPLFTPDGREVVYLASGRIRITNVESGESRGLDVTAELDVDFDVLKMASFEQGWAYMRDHFYDEDLHGADWEGVRAAFEPRIRGARTMPDYSRLMNMMLGELNGSHLGHSFPSAGSTSNTGALGLRFDRTVYEASGRLRVTEIVPLGPAHVAGGIDVGDFVLAVAGTTIDAATNLDALLQETQGKKVTLRVAASPDGSGASTVDVRPVSYQVERRLEYRDWVESNRAYVNEASDGRLGYVHMPDMSEGSLRQLYVDLDADNHDREGVVIDIRGNNGGFVNAYALDAFARRGYLTMQLRGLPEANARSTLGQRALELGTVLVVNQNTLSDGEDFTEGYRALGLGQVVGEPTAGWIIFTWSAGLVDGTTVRMPRARIRGSQGDDMELYPRPVDVEVVRPMGESYSGIDRQLDAAVRILLTGGG